MNYLEEQKNELEALSEIYYNELEVRSNKQPISFTIKVRPQASNYQEPMMMTDDQEDESDDSDEDESESENQIQCPTVDLLFELPPKYPDSKPSIQILDSQNLEEREVDELLKNLNAKTEECLGNVMIFTLVSEIVEWLSAKAEREANQIEEEKNKKLEELEAEEKKKCHGTPVTAASFLAWKAKFDAELLRLRLEQQKKLAEQNPTSQKRLTGREMFETDKALAESDLNFVDDLDQNQLEALMQNIEGVDLDDDLNDEDIDDLETESDDDDDDEEYGSEEEELSEESEDDAKSKSKKR